ncbi:4-(cytidine 5'-diphospho)-2-C-methyl-D-erythritol kinase [Nocardiopsis sp. NPDC050513]|uniref:4-(cytidine 5'-diphospho)-2-C-methyl-D-erythritol kinase n=1 Tax=Nocardiopsis sp. NPDC050513 TaxID=3364338 RepID=UPI003788C427
MTVSTTVTVRVPAKVNLQLAVGPSREDGFHALVNVFHAVSLFDEVTVKEAPARQEPELVTLTASGGTRVDLGGVPLDATNLAARAAALLAEETGKGSPVEIHLDKRIPVAGGMAGGSADAAATLVACDRLWGCGLPETDLLDLAARLGSDVPFPLLGRTAVGTGRGEILEPLAAPGRYRWVFALSSRGLSTARVFAEYDRLRPDAPAPLPSPAMEEALAAGDAASLGAALTNDLERAALSLRPDLAGVLAAGRAAGALGALVSGSGPTCAFLVGDEDGAATPGVEAAVVRALEAEGVDACVPAGSGDVPGTTVV